MDLLAWIGDRWVQRKACPDPAALTAVAHLKPATVVTGASEGLGLALAQRIAGEDRAIVLLARSVETLLEAAEALRQRHPRAYVVAEALDVSDPDAFDQLQSLLARHGLYLDVLVNNAGIAHGGHFAEIDPEAIDQLVATNIAAVTRLTRLALPAMRARGRGGIMNMASLGAFTPGPWQAAYFASKAYVLSLTAAIGAECAGEGVRVCVVAFGPVDTGIHRKMDGGRSYYRRLLPSSTPERMARLCWQSYRLGRRVVVPGFVNGLLAWSARAMPYELLLPLVGWLMRPRSNRIDIAPAGSRAC
jgi:short-subunit dehydrogenase